jgi:hypothetical protein
MRALLVWKSLAEFNVPLPTLEERVATYHPNLGKKPKYLESFPKDARALQLRILKEIIDELGPYAPADRESEELLINSPPGGTIPFIKKELMKRAPWIKMNPHYPEGPSEDVVAHLLSAPNKSRKAAGQYQGLVKTKLARGRNDKEDDLPLVKFI